MFAPTILIIDDVRDIVDEMIDMLDLMDLSAIGAGSIGDAIERLLAHPTVRLIVCDVRLPRESGTDIIDRVAQHPALADRLLRYIFMTGDADKAREIETDFNQLVMTKPVDPRALISSISGLLERS